MTMATRIAASIGILLLFLLSAGIVVAAGVLFWQVVRWGIELLCKAMGLSA